MCTVPYVKHKEFGLDIVLGRVFDFIPRGNERTKMRSRRKYQPIYIVFLNIFTLFLRKQGIRDLYLLYRKEVGLPQKTSRLFQPGQTSLNKCFLTLHYYN